MGFRKSSLLRKDRIIKNNISRKHETRDKLINEKTAAHNNKIGDMYMNVCIK